MPELLGAQDATLRLVPPGRSDDRGVRLAGKLGINLDPWQADILSESARTQGDHWSAREVATIVPRQNGKTYLTVARILAGALLYGEKLIVYSAHQHRTAREMWMLLREICSHDLLKRRVHIPSDQERREQINFDNGSRFRIFSRSRGAIRGMSPDVVIFDEALMLTNEMVDAAMPALAAKANAQIWYLSSAGTFESFTLLRLRQRGHAGGGPGFAYWEWFATEDDDYRDPRVHAKANPAYGTRLMSRAVDTELQSLSKRAFQRERLGVWQESAVDPVLRESDVVALTVPLPTPPEDNRSIGWGVDVSTDRTVTSVAAAFDGPDGVPVVVTVDGRSGCAWLPERLAQLAYKYGAEPVAFDARAGLVDLMERAEREFDVPILPLRWADYPIACAAFAQRVAEHRVHFGQAPPLLMDAVTAVARPMPTGWVWDRKTSTPPTHLIAATCALHALEHNVGGSAVSIF